MHRFLLGLASFLFLITVNAPAQEKDGGGITPMCVSGCLGGVVVTPDGEPSTVLAYTAGHTAVFVVRNTGTSFASATLTCSTTGPLTCGTVTPSSVSLDPNEEVEVTVTYSAGAGGVGEVGLSSGTDYGWYTVTVEAVGPPTIVLQNQNGSNVDRGLCLTTGAGEAAGISCGDLFVTHGLPAYRTLGRDRSLALLYNSATATGLVLVAANVSQPPSTNTPQSIRLFLTVGNPTTGMAKDSAQYASFSAGQTKQMVIGRGITGLATGAYPMTLTARNVYATSTYDATVTGTVLVVNRSASEFGKGWALLGLEQVFTDPSDSTRRVWVAGDGSIRLYTKPTPGSNSFLGAVGDAPDSLVRFDTLCTPGCQQWYRRDLKHGAAVTFDATGRHRFTRNRVGARTLFSWGTVAGQARLSTITVPPDTGTARRYTFHWNATTARLDSIRDPGARRLKSTMALDTLRALTDPDGQVTRFTYTGGRLSKRIYPRKGMQGDSAYTSFTYANNARVTVVNIQTDSAATLFATTALTPWDEQGLALPYADTSTGVTSAATGLPSRVDGPIAGTGDASDILVNRFGQPTRITNLGLNTITTIAYDSAASLPAVPTRVQYPHATTPGAGGRIVRMSWNPRGNLVERRDSTRHLDLRPTKATTYSYANANAPDSPSRVQDVLGRHTDYRYTALGLTDSVIDPGGHRTSFAYIASGAFMGLVTSVTEHQVETWVQSAGTDSVRNQVQGFTYDPNGNLRTGTSPAGVVTSYVVDSLGRITDVYDPLGTRTRHTYDVMNRETLQTFYTSKHTHPTVPSPLGGCLTNQFVCVDSTRLFLPGLPSTLLTRYGYSMSGTVDSILDPRNVKRKYLHDARLQVAREQDEAGAQQLFYYNRNGLLDSIRTRTGFVTRYRYDSLGRRTALIFPQRASTFPGDGTLIPGDSLSSTYDLLGNLLVSRNQQGHVIRRTYWGDGALRTKTTVTGFTDSLDYTYDATGARTLLVAGGQDSVRYVYGQATGTLDSMVVRMDSSGFANAMATRVFTFTYDALGRRRQITYPIPGMTVAYSYDALGVLRRVVSANPAAPTGGTDRFDFTFLVDSVDAIGRILHQRTSCTSFNSQDSLLLPCGKGGAAGSQRNLSNRYNRRSELVIQRDELKVDSLRYDASGNLIVRYQSSGGYPGRDTMAIAALSNRVQYDRNVLSGTRVDFRYDADGSRVRDSAPVTTVNAPLQRWEYYDALGRNTGYRYADGFDPNGNLAHHFHPTRCQYDPEGQPSLPCALDAVWTTHDGPNAAAMITGWRFVSAPGADELLLGRFALSAAYRQTLYFVMDGQGRQLAVGDSSGFLVDADVSTDRGGWQYAGATQNGFTFDVNRQGSGAPGGVSYFRNRAYDSRTGRWKQEDPLGVAGGLNLYQFNGNNPATYTDPFGLCPIPPSNCVDIAVAVASVVEFVAAPSLGTFVNAALDVAGAVPGVPSFGVAKRVIGAADAGARVARGGESVQAAQGRAVHRAWDPGPGFVKEERLPSGKRPDAVNYQTRVVKELKPNNPSAMRRGERQVEGYRKELEQVTGEKWTGVVETYSPR